MGERGEGGGYGEVRIVEVQGRAAVGGCVAAVAVRSGRQSAWLVHRIGRGARTGGHRDDSPADNRDTPPAKLLARAPAAEEPTGRGRAGRGAVAADATGGAWRGTGFAMTSPAPGGFPLPSPARESRMPRTPRTAPGPIRRGRSFAGYQDDPIRGRIGCGTFQASPLRTMVAATPARGARFPPIGQPGLRSSAHGPQVAPGSHGARGVALRTICFGVFGREPSRSRGRSPAATVGGASRWRRSEMQTAPAEAGAAAREGEEEERNAEGRMVDKVLTERRSLLGAASVAVRPGSRPGSPARYTR